MAGQAAMAMELDFEVEARNAQRTACLLRARTNVRVPEVRTRGHVAPPIHQVPSHPQYTLVPKPTMSS